jgi:hypothetical protein
MLTETAHLDEYCRLVDANYAKGAMHGVEQTVVECVKGFQERGADSERAFTQSLYFGLIKAVATLQAQIDGSMHFQTNRRREIEDRLAALEKRGESSGSTDTNAALQKRIEQLEQSLIDNPPFKYLGPWTEMEYSKNDTVTHGGSLWIAKRRTRSKPEVNTGAAELDWQLAVKRGRDGRDAKDFVK